VFGRSHLVTVLVVTTLAARNASAVASIVAIVFKASQ
jgi:hypothetical protein